MRRRMLTWLCLLLCPWAGNTLGADAPLVDNSKVVPMTRFLEAQPLSKDAPMVRAFLLQWEDASKDVVDVICPDMFAPLLDKSTRYGDILSVQFIFGSAAYQIANPAEKGKLIPAQLAGMQSMLKAYQSILAQESDARIPLLDKFAKDQADGKLPQLMPSLVAAHCDAPPT